MSKESSRDDTRTLVESESASVELPALGPDDRYAISGEHARGGIGRILRAHDRKLERDVALKELINPSERARARFDREVRITARLEHPAVIPVHDAGHWDDDGRPYYSMKLVSGQSLKEVIDDTHTRRERLALLPNMIAVAEAIGYAHSVGVIHRDLKPSNVLVGGYGETVVIDWGLAKELGTEDDAFDSYERDPLRDGGDQLTVAGAVVGTPAFMAPEQARGEPVDERADVYALGAMLYHLLSGRTPYQGSSEEVVALVREQAPVPLRELAPDVPADLAAIAAKAMAREPGDRYPDGGALAADLTRFRTGQLVGAHEYSWGQLVARWARRNRAVAAALVLFLVAATVGSALFLQREQSLRHDAEVARDSAERERDRADEQTLILLEKQGRSELAAGRPFRASVYLAEALRRDPDRRAPRWLVSQALEQMGAYERSFRGHEHDVVGLALSPDGSLLVTGSTDRTARVWDVATGRELLERLHEDDLEAATFAPDGRTIATADDKTHVWSVDDGALIHTFDVPGFRLAFSPDGAWLAVGTKAGEVVFVEPATGRVGRRWHRPGARIQGIAWRSGSHELIVASDAGIAVALDPTGRRTDRTVAQHDHPLSGVSVSPDGARMLLVGHGPDYYVHDISTGALISRKRLPDGTQISHAAFRPDGRTAVISGVDGIVRVVHLRSGASFAAFDALAVGRLNRFALGPRGDLLVTGGVGGKADAWRLDRVGFRVRRVELGERASYVGQTTWLDGGRLLAVGTSDGVVSVRDANTDDVLRTISVDSSVTVQSFDPRGTRLVNSGTSEPEPTPALWDMASGEKLVSFDVHTSRVYHNDPSADGTRVATSSYDGTVRQWSFATGEPVGAVVRSIDGRRFTAVAYAPDDRRIATTDEDGTLQVWDRSSGDELLRVDAHPSWIQDLVFSPDGKRIATAGRLDLSARIWDAHTGDNLLSVPAQRGNVLVVEFSPDGSVFATAGTDNVLNLRDAATGELLRTIAGPRATIDFHPTRPELVAGGPDGYLVSWNIAIDDRPPDAIAADVRARSPWRLEGGRLVLTDGH